MSALFSTPKMPKIKPAIPLPSEAALTAARRKAIAGATQSGGNRTLLAGGSTGGRETLGA